MTDFESFWRCQDEIRTVVDAVMGDSIWDLSFNQERNAIELELTRHIAEEDMSGLCCQFPLPADYDGEGTKGTKFVFWR